MQKRYCAKMTVTWDEEAHSITLTACEWAHVRAGKSLRIRGRVYYHEGRRYRDVWKFGGGLHGTLVVEYGQQAANGFDGYLSDATIVEAGRN
ncbi:MAG: hypothetical protein ACREU5_02250 [Burkholderiales bacterium]